jgi:putative redox protein
MDLSADGIRLATHLALPGGAASAPSLHGLVLCHGFPAAGVASPASGQGYPELADRLAAEAGWAVLSLSFRGTGGSEGNFSLGGWLNDLKAAIEALHALAAGEDERVHGVASFAAPADFAERASDAPGFVNQARAAGAIRDADFPADLGAWARELREIRPLSLIGKIPPRPILLVHGSNDEVVPLLDARALADAAEGEVELRVLVGAGHRLRHDPRAIALLIGWLDRQHI